LPPRRFNAGCLRRVIHQTEHDVLHLHSFFSPRVTIAPLTLRRLGLIPPRPVIVAPHGEFSPGAIRLKGTKKWAYIQAAKAIGLYRDVIWQASSELEEQDIRRVFGGSVRVFVAPNLRCPVREADSVSATPGKEPGTLKIVFFSRISRKKNLHGALRLLTGLTGRVEIHIYGPKDDPAYWSECQPLIAALPGNVRVEDHGPLTHEQVCSMLREQHLLFLPTLGENFCFVILESFLAGCPVLISDRTPWRRLEQRGVGWDVPLEDAEGFRRVLQRCIDMGDDEYQQMSRRAQEYGNSVASDKSVLEKHYGLLEFAVGRARAAA